MTDKRSLLFYGELPPEAIHGIAYSNMINLRLLEGNFDVVIIKEKSTLNNKGTKELKKFFGRLKDHYQILFKASKRRFDFFYLTFSISFKGGLKTLFSIVCFRLLNSGKVILHIHRGDFIIWYRKNCFNSWLANLVIKLSGKVIVLSDDQKSALNELSLPNLFVSYIIQLNTSLIIH
ncbi:MAG: hypothetical protein IPH69_06580 [Bacteroidales bacterium]|nr:hypothetical protein [Bacteroidales bacterium]